MLKLKSCLGTSFLLSRLLTLEKDFIISYGIIIVGDVNDDSRSDDVFGENPSCRRMANHHPASGVWGQIFIATRKLRQHQHHTLDDDDALLSLILIVTMRYTTLSSAVALLTTTGKVTSFPNTRQVSKMTPLPKMNRSWGLLESFPRDNKASFPLFRIYMKDDGTFPNNSDCPLILYQHAFQGSGQEATKAIRKSGWTDPWAWGVYPFHHYHSTAWELLLCVSGNAQIQLGGPTGPTLEVKSGDLILVPPGFAHKQVTASGDFTLLGSYPSPVHIDTLRGAPTEAQRKSISECQVPSKDPVFGMDLAPFFG
jgi:uncharacterized protein YjlB